MNVMYISDNNYADLMGISMLSLMENNKDIEEIIFYVVNDNIGEGNLNKIKTTVERYNRKIIFMDTPELNSIIGNDGDTVQDWWTMAVYARLLLEEVFREYKDIKKILYLDCDTMVCGHLIDLWESNIKGNIVAGVGEAMGTLHKKAIGLSKQDVWYNSGVLLVDIEKWREEHIDQKIRNFLKENQGRQMEYVDETVFNCVLHDHIYQLPQKYNFTSLSTYFTADELKAYRKSKVIYSEKERLDSLNDVRIVHFTSTFMDERPWNFGCHSPFLKEWSGYKNMSLWKDEKLKSYNRGRFNKVCKKIMSCLPRKLRIEIAGVMHAYLKPLKYMRTN